MKTLEERINKIYGEQAYDKFEFCEQVEIFEFLDDLRDSGVRNMFGASADVVEAFGIEQGYAKKLVADWMKSCEDK